MNKPSNLALSVSQLNREAKQLLEASFSLIRVEGELTNLARPASGHWYFTLKDDRAQVRCAMFRRQAQSVSFQPKEGDQVVVLAKVSLYEGRGDFQLICDQMIPSGEGQLQKAFEQVKQRLSARGLFDSSRKKTLPKHPRCIGVITSSSGAAIHDILHVLKRRFPGIPVNLYPSAVQGTEAAEQLINALALANRHKACDVLIIGRGGGSLEDLWPFNEVALAEAIASSSIPIVSAVGHETDTTISDLVADYRAPTPSAAAEILSPDQHLLKRQLIDTQNTFTRRTLQQFQQAQQRLDLLQLRLKHPGDRLRQQRQQLSDLTSSLMRLQLLQIQRQDQGLTSLTCRLVRRTPEMRSHALRIEKVYTQLQQRLHASLKHRRFAFEQTVCRLNSVSPLATLNRGFSYLQNQQGEIVYTTQQTSIGDTLVATLKDGKLSCQVTDIISENTQESPD